jgi:hypothetical protein
LIFASASVTKKAKWIPAFAGMTECRAFQESGSSIVATSGK